jgi:predicted Zn-dependent peptidase
MKRILITTLMLGALAAPGFTGGTVDTFTLSNGLLVLHKEITSNPLVAIDLFLKNGAIDEQPAQAGLANFTQVLLMQGTKTRNSEALAAAIEDIGGNIASDVEHDYSHIGISLLDSHVENAAELLSDIVQNPAFPEDEIEKERRNTLAGIVSRKDQIHNAANDLFNETFYDGHPYSWPDIGRENTVKKFKQKDFIAWHKRYYTAQNAVLIIAGNIGRDRAKALAEKYFASLPKGEKMALYPVVAKPPSRTVTSRSVKFKQAYLMTGYPAPSLHGREFVTLKILNAMLGGRMTGRLFTELREKLSLAYEVNSIYPTRRELSRFVIYLGLDAKNLELADRRIKELITELKTTPVPEKELEDTKNFIRGVYLLDHQTVERQVWYMGWWESMGMGYTYDQKYLDQLMAVTSADIREAANKIFADNALTVEVLPAK